MRKAAAVYKNQLIGKHHFAIIFQQRMDFLKKGKLIFI